MGGPLRVVANFFPMVDIAAHVGADRVKVTNLTPVGAEPHDIELTPKQVAEVQDADVVVYVGRDFQPAVADLARRRKTGSVDVAKRIQFQPGDPHFWLDPTLMATATDEITAALVAASPHNASTFRANADAYKQRLATLDTAYKQGLASCARKEIVTTHAAFSYLARRYGLTQLAIAGISPDAEPDATKLASLADTIKAKHVTTVFFEELASPKVAAALARETGTTTTAVLSPLEGLSADESKAGKDYVAVMNDNLQELRVALSCQ